MAVTLYRQVGKGKARRYQKVNLGRGRRPADLTGPYFLRTRWLTALAHGNTPAMTLTRQSPPATQTGILRSSRCQRPGHSEPGRRQSDENH